MKVETAFIITLTLVVAICTFGAYDTMQNIKHNKEKIKMIKCDKDDYPEVNFRTNLCHAGENKRFDICLYEAVKEVCGNE